MRVCLWGCRVARVSRGPSLCVSLSYSSHIWNLTSGRYCDPLYPLKQAFPPARCPTEFLEFQLRAGGPAGCLDSHPSQPGGRGRSPLALPGRWAGPGPTDCSGKVHLGPPVLRVPREAGDQVTRVWRSPRAKRRLCHVQAAGGPPSLPFPCVHRLLPPLLASISFMKSTRFLDLSLLSQEIFDWHQKWKKRCHSA